MDKKIKGQFPAWTNSNEMTFSNDDLILSNDIDSLLSCAYLQRLFGHKITRFYDFNALYSTKTAGTEAIGVDIALLRGKCYDNHITQASADDWINPDAANVNNICGIHSGNYFNKYAGSTLLQIIALYDVPISHLSDDAKMVLLAIDSTFKGYYSRYSNDCKANKHYLYDVLELPQLYDLQKQKNEKDFYQIMKKYFCYEKIKIDENGQLQTNINISALAQMFDIEINLQQDQFFCEMCFNQKIFELKGRRKKSCNNKFYSLAFTRKSSGVCSIAV